MLEIKKLLFQLALSGRLMLFIVAHLLGSLIIFVSSIAILVFLIRKPLRQYKPVDLAIFDKVSTVVTNGRTRFMQAITLLGKHQFLIPANLILIFYFLWIPRQNWYSISVATIALSSLALMILLKQLFRRKRPLSPLLKAVKGLSFPSGHAIMAVTFFGLIIYCVNHADWPPSLKVSLIVLLVILILLIGFSRIYLRVHYASDVVSGFIIGLLWLLISLALIKKAQQYSKLNQTSSPGTLTLPRPVANLDPVHPNLKNLTGSANVIQRISIEDDKICFFADLQCSSFPENF